MSERKLKGKLTISRPRGGSYERIVISLTDELSGSQCVEIEVAPADFAEALVGASYQPCEFAWRPAVVGMRYEHKEVDVPYDGDCVDRKGNARRDVATKAFAPFEVDGWRGRVDDLFNHHRRTKEGYMVVFTRHVPATETKGDDDGG